MFGLDVTRDKTLALAGLFQAAQLVVDLSQKDEHDADALQASAASLLQLNSNSVGDLFDGIAGLRLGLDSLLRVFQSPPSPINQEVVRYLISMNKLSQRLEGSSETGGIIARNIDSMEAHYGRQWSADQEEDLYSAIGQLYQKTLSELTPRIIVRGVQGRLEDQQTVTRIRVALFAGVRAAFLWNQLGGRQWHVVFMRKQYVASANNLR